MSGRLRHYLAGTVREIELRGNVFLIGNGQGNDLVLEGSRVPEVAVRLTVDSEGTAIDISAQGVVRLNGRKTKSARLNAGDRIEIDRHVIVYEEDGAEGRSDGKAHAPGAGAITMQLKQLSDSVGRERDVRKLLEGLIATVFSGIGGEEAFVFVLNSDGKPRVFVSSSRDDSSERFSDTIVQEVLRRGECVCIPSVLVDPSFSGARSIVELRLSSVLCCPMVVAGTTVGVIYLGSRRPEVSFSESDLDILKIYALLGGMLINHVEYISQQYETIRQLTSTEGAEGIVAESAPMRAVLNDVAAVAQADIAVVLQGETGTGKDVIAKLIHRRSSRAGAEFVAVNCSSLNEQLLESELFGHKKGAFTGAHSDHKGLFSAARGGTLFLDEIGDMAPSLQAKLLRTLESGMIRPVGSSTEESVDVRLICATNRNLSELVEGREFREDLYYRINQFCITLPPLRERGDDIVLLAHYFLHSYRARYPFKDVTCFHPDSLKTMAVYEWPGNVRQLAAAVHKGVLSAAGPLVRVEVGEVDRAVGNFDEATREFQHRLIRRALGVCEGNREQAARMLGMSRSSFFRYLASARK